MDEVLGMEGQGRCGWKWVLIHRFVRLRETDTSIGQKPKSKANTKTSKTKKPTGAPKSKAKSKPKKPKAKKLKAKTGVVKRDTEADDIGPQFKVELEPGVEVSVEEHGRNCTCCPRQAYKTKPEKAYKFKEEQDDEYEPDD
jgi:hypothetical protein